MAEPEPPPKADALADHPLSGEPKRRGRGAARGTLELFPDVGELQLREPSEEAEPQGSLSPARRGDAGPSVPGATPGPGADVPEEPAVDADLGSAVEVTFARRVMAGLADLLILALVAAVELTAGALLLDLRFPPAAFLGVGAFILLVAVVLQVLAPFVWGTTPGMALADLRIVAPDGGTPTLAASFLRFLGFLLTGLLAGVPLLVAAFDRRGRTLADLLSATTVVPASRPVPAL